MLVDCICGESKFAVNAEPIGFDGRLVRCGKCGKEWFQGSKLEDIEKKLVNLDQGLYAKEIKLADGSNYYSDKISSIEKELKSKSKEIEDQRLLEKRISLFESRIKDSEAEILRQKKHDERINVLKRELEKRTLDLFIKTTALEKRSAELQEKMNEKDLDERLSSLEERLIQKKVGGKVINTKKPIEVFDNETEFHQPKPFEIEEIQKKSDDNIKKEELKDEKSAISGENKSVKKNESFEETHNDTEDTSRIGRWGDLLKRKKL